MRASRRLSFAALACVALMVPFAFASDVSSDQATAERLLGPQWQQISRRAGMIFTATVLAPDPQSPSASSTGGPSPVLRTAVNATRFSQTAAQLSRTIPAIELRFRIDRPIAGVRAGQIITIHQWIGASSRQPALHAGDRVLLFLYPPSRLGLTSPVGGAQGQIRLDPTGQHVAQNAQSTILHAQPGSRSPSRTSPSITQLERAIRSARGE